MDIGDLLTFKFSLWELKGQLQFEPRPESDDAEDRAVDRKSNRKPVPPCLRHSNVTLRKAEGLVFASSIASNGPLRLWCPLHGRCHERSRTKFLKLNKTAGTLGESDLTHHQRVL